LRRGRKSAKSEENCAERLGAEEENALWQIRVSGASSKTGGVS
jgi:hypothetical protein